MRRTDRQVTEPDEIRKIIDQCQWLHLGLCDGMEPYVVPVNFGYEERQGKYIFYFHGAMEGKKLDLIRKNPRVSLCMETAQGLISGDSAQHFSYRYASVMGQARAELLEEREEKYHGLEVLFRHYSDMDFSVPEKTLDATAVIRLTAEALTAKRRS